MALRADAEQNRTAVVAAAAKVFCERGAGASLEDVAAEAGVGIATLYRRFPSRDDLLEAVFEGRMASHAARAGAAAERALTEPWPAFSEYVLYLLEAQASDRAFAQLIAEAGAEPRLFSDQLRLALRNTILLVSRAKRAGVLRPGFDHSDLYLLTLANAGLTTGEHPDAWRRFGALMLSAFSADAPGGKLPSVASSWR